MDYLQLTVLASVYIFYGVSLGLLFRKASYPLHLGLVPILNVMAMLEIIGRPKAWVIWIIFTLTSPFFSLFVWFEFVGAFGLTGLKRFLFVVSAPVSLPLMAFSTHYQFVGKVKPDSAPPSV